MDMIYYITYMVSTIFTYIFGKLSKKHKWNEQLPIPIQNMVVGTFVFVIAYVFCIIMKYDISTQELLHQVIACLGGARNCYIRL